MLQGNDDPEFFAVFSFRRTLHDQSFFESGGRSATSFKFPITPPQNPSGNFIVKINATGDKLIYSTFVSGVILTGIAVDPSGNAIIIGGTYPGATDFPTTPDAFQTKNQGGADAIVAILNAEGKSLLYSTYLGGSGDDRAYGIALDSSGNIYLTGYTNSTDFPLASPLRNSLASTCHSVDEPFVTMPS